MPSNLTDVDTFTSPIVVPSDGDALSAASVIAGMQGLANRTRNLFNRIGVREVGYVADDGPDGNTFVSLSSPTYDTAADVPGVELVLSDVQSGDVILVVAQVAVTAPGSGLSVNLLSLTAESSSFSQAPIGTVQNFSTSENVAEHMVLIGHLEAQHSEAHTIKVQAASVSASGTAAFRTGWSIAAVVLRNAT